MNQDRNRNHDQRSNGSNGDRSSGNGRSNKVVFAITERGEKSYWTRVGVAYTNRDGSLTLKLDALPVSGTLQVRDEEARGERDDDR